MDLLCGQICAPEQPRSRAPSPEPLGSQPDGSVPIRRLSWFVHVHPHPAENQIPVGIAFFSKWCRKLSGTQISRFATCVAKPVNRHPMS